MKDTIKKYWFVGLVGVFLFAGLIYLATDTLQTSVKAKQTEDGKDVVFSYDGKDYTADDLYDEVYSTLDIGAIIPVLELEVYRDAMEPTKAIESDAKANSENIIASLKQEYGEEWEFTLDRLLVQSGYVTKTGPAGLEDYLKIMEIRNHVEREYVKDNPDLYKTFMDEKKPRIISHILIQMADVENPTEDEQAKLDAAKAALKEDKAKFATVAQEHSQDGSAQNGGSLGLVTTDSIASFVEDFQDQVYKVEANETTEWFTTEYGYHIIHVDATDMDGFEKLNNFDVYNAIFEENPKILLDITWDQIQKQDITFGDNKELNKAITEHYTAKEEN